MWPATFDQRLLEWRQLRIECQSQTLDECLLTINHWWFRTPWAGHSLHWDDCPEWPDPWQLLSEDRFCSLARGLGMLYTICLLQRSDLGDAELVECNQDNLVLVQNRKYILNWDPDEIVNIPLESYNRRRRITQQHIQSQIH
jgi:hypothetical protein